MKLEDIIKKLCWWKAAPTPLDPEKQHKAKLLDRLLGEKLPGYRCAKAINFYNRNSCVIFAEIAPFPRYGVHRGALVFFEHTYVQALDGSKDEMLDAILEAAQFSDVKFCVPNELRDMLGTDRIVILEKGTSRARLEILLDLVCPETACGLQS